MTPDRLAEVRTELMLTVLDAKWKLIAEELLKESDGLRQALLQEKSRETNLREMVKSMTQQLHDVVNGLDRWLTP